MRYDPLPVSYAVTCNCRTFHNLLMIKNTFMPLKLLEEWQEVMGPAIHLADVPYPFIPPSHPDPPDSITLQPITGNHIFGWKCALSSDHPSKKFDICTTVGSTVFFKDDTIFARMTYLPNFELEDRHTKMSMVKLLCHIPDTMRGGKGYYLIFSHPKALHLIDNWQLLADEFWPHCVSLDGFRRWICGECSLSFGAGTVA